MKGLHFILFGSFVLALVLKADGFKPSQDCSAEVTENLAWNEMDDIDFSSHDRVLLQAEVDAGAELAGVSTSPSIPV
jgi:hypothetical protein